MDARVTSRVPFPFSRETIAILTYYTITRTRTIQKLIMKRKGSTSPLLGRVVRASRVCALATCRVPIGPVWRFPRKTARQNDSVTFRLLTTRPRRTIWAARVCYDERVRKRRVTRRRGSTSTAEAGDRARDRVRIRRRFRKRLWSGTVCRRFSVRAHADGCTWLRRNFESKSGPRTRHRVSRYPSASRAKYASNDYPQSLFPLRYDGISHRT